jgi:tryptophan synthase alpha chain
MFSWFRITWRRKEKEETEMSEKNRITATFSRLASKGECGLICYVVAGYPNLGTCQAVIEELVAEGADMIEIGIPFSDPIADGPTIQAACHAALEKGVRPADALTLASNIRKSHPDLPILFMTYSNILARKGFEKFAILSRSAGVDGFIIPDMPVEEAQEYSKAAKNHDLYTVFLASPNTPSDRLARILDNTSGFLYLVSVFGITGARAGFENYTLKAVKDAKMAAGSRVPVAVGFGISKPEHVKYMKSAGADAVIVGSALVDIISKSLKNKEKIQRKIRQYARTMKASCR